MNNDTEEINLFQDLPLAERAQALKDNSYSSEKEHVKRYLEKEDIEAIKDKISSESIFISEKEDELKELSSGIRSEIKSSKSKLKENLTLLKAGYTEEIEDVFMMDDQESGRMMYYTADGIFLKSRPLLPAEKQIKMRVATGTND